MQGNVLQIAIERLCYIHARVFDQRSEVGDAQCGIVVAADDKDLFAVIDQLGYKAVKQCHGLRLGRSALIDIACDEDGIDLFLIGDVNDLVEHGFLIIQEQQVVHLLAEMQIGDMEKLHDMSPHSRSVLIAMFNKDSLA